MIQNKPAFFFRLPVVHEEYLMKLKVDQNEDALNKKLKIFGDKKNGITTRG